MSGHIFSSLRARLTLLVLLAVFPALLLLVLSAAEQRASDAERAKAEALRLAHLVAAQHERSVTAAGQFLALLAELPELHGTNHTACSSRLIRARADTSGFANLAVVGLDGRVLCSAIPVPPDFRTNDRAWFHEIGQTNDLTIGAYILGRITRRPVLEMAAPVRDQGRVVGYAYASLDLTWFSSIPSTGQLPEHATVAVLDDAGEVLLRTPQLAEPQYEVARPLIEQIVREREGSTELPGLDGVVRLYGFTELARSGRGAILVIGVPAEVAYADANRALRRNVAVFTAVALLVLLASWLAGERLLLRYFRPLVGAARGITSGDLSARTGLGHTGHGEISELAASFDQMAETVERREAELRQASEDQLAFERRLQHTQRLESLGVLAGGVAHDFNNLLAIIRGNVGLALLDTPPGDPLRDALDPIDQAARRATELTRQLLAYAGQGRYAAEPVDLNDLISGAQQLLRSSVPKDVELNIELAPDLPLLIADSSQIRQIILNLVLNAGEAMQGRTGSVRVATGASDAPQLVGECVVTPQRRHERYVTLLVRDEGVGIEPALLGRVFEPFYTTKFIGRGLGLAAALGIVRGHDGVLCIESEPGRGTVVRVALPAPAIQLPLDPAPNGEPLAPAANA